MGRRWIRNLSTTKEDLILANIHGPGDIDLGCSHKKYLYLLTNHGTVMNFFINMLYIIECNSIGYWDNLCQRIGHTASPVSTCQLLFFYTKMKEHLKGCVNSHYFLPSCILFPTWPCATIDQFLLVLLVRCFFPHSLESIPHILFWISLLLNWLCGHLLG